VRALALTAVLFIASTAGAAKDPSYVMKGPCRVRTTSGPAFDQTFEPTLRATVSGPDKDLRIEVSVMHAGASGAASEGVTCVLRGVKVGSKVTLPLGQKCPVHVDRDGIQGDLDGVLKAGSATMVGKTITMKTTWDVAGKVKLLFKKTNVTGVVESDVKGART
jgi:hypothetical protein